MTSSSSGSRRPAFESTVGYSELLYFVVKKIKIEEIMKKLWKFKVENKDCLSTWWDHKVTFIITQILDLIAPHQDHRKSFLNRQISSLRIHTHMVK